jgi:hypothetical protein
MAEPDVTPTDLVLALESAALALLAAFVAIHRRTRSRDALAGAIGVVVLLAGSWIQWRGVAPRGAGPGHDARDHVVEMMALPLVDGGARAARVREA